MGARIATVLGDVAAEELGVTDYHEHLYVEPPTWLLRIDADFALSDEVKSAEELSRWSDSGGRTIIEMTAPDFGRNVDAIRRIAERVPKVNVLLTTGFNRPWYMGRWVYEMDEASAVRVVVGEVTKGIGASQVRAAVIKAGTEYNTLDHAGRKLLRIAACGHKETGAPIVTHTTAGTVAVEQVEYLAEWGVSPSRICLSHMDRNLDFELHSALARKGVYLGYDSPGKIKYGNDSDRIALIKRMWEAGLSHRILLGNDLARPSYFRSYGGGPGLDYVLTKFVPRLGTAGIPRTAVDGILVDNPRRFLSCAEA